MKYRFAAAEPFWKSFYALPDSQKATARAAWRIFKQDPFDPRLRTHKVHRLSALLGRTVYAVEVGADLRVLFYMAGDMVWTVDVGTHDIYKA